MRTNNQRGTALVYIMVVTSFVCAIIFASLLRTQVGLQAVKDRHLGGLARDLAENGVQLQLWMIGRGQPATQEKPAVQKQGLMAGHSASFSSFATVQPDGSYIIVSTGALEQTPGQRGRTIQLTVTVRRMPKGQWTIVAGHEQYLN